MNKLIDLLNAYGFYYTKEMLEEIKEYSSNIDLIKKARGESFNVPTEEVFGNDYKELKELCNRFGYTFDEVVWYD